MAEPDWHHHRVKPSGVHFSPYDTNAGQIISTDKQTLQDWPALRAVTEVMLPHCNHLRGQTDGTSPEPSAFASHWRNFRCSSLSICRDELRSQQLIDSN